MTATVPPRSYRLTRPDGAARPSSRSVAVASP